MNRKHNAESYLPVALLFAASVLWTLLCACQVSGRAPNSDSFTLVSYNVGNLFDDRVDGTEYAEYVPGASQWDSDAYHRKLDATAHVLAALSPRPAVLILQEVENRGVLDTLLDHYLGWQDFQARVVAPVDNSAVQNGVASCFPVTRVRSHTVFSPDVSVRNIVEVHLDVDGIPLVLLANHWKSKRGGAEETETLRRRAAAVVAWRVAELLAQNPCFEIVVAGDLNESADEFVRIGESYQTALMPVAAAGEASADGRQLYVSFAPVIESVLPGGVVLFSPWKLSGSEGSYLFNDHWESPDQVLLSAGLTDTRGLRFAGFHTDVPADVMEAFLSDSTWTQPDGYSDHLPVVLRLERAQ